MLDLMRKHSKNWIIKVFLALIIFVFIFYFGTMRGTQKPNVVAEVGGISITTSAYSAAYQRIYEAYRKELGDKLDAEMVRKLDLKQKALNRVVEDAIIALKAQELAVGISPQEINDLIMRDSRFSSNGGFDDRKFSDFVREKGLTPDEYANDLARDVLTRKVLSIVQSGVRVSPLEIQDFNAMQSLKMNVEFVRIPLQSAFGKISPSEKDLQEYLAANGKDFRQLERYRLKYIAYLGKSYEGKIKISESEALQHYERFKDKYKRSKNDKSAPPFSAVRGKVEADLRQASGMYAAADASKAAYEQIYQQDNFDAYAKSKGLAVQTTSLFPIDKMPAPFDKITNFAGTLRGLQSGTPSKIVSDERGYYIVAIAEKRESGLPPLSSIRGELERRYKRDNAAALCEAQAKEIIAAIKSGKTFADAAKEKRFKVQESGVFPIAGGKAPSLGGGPELLDELMAISKANPYSEKPIAVSDGFVIIKLKERIEPKRGEKIANEAALADFLFTLKSRETIAYWLQSVKERMEKDGTLKYHRTVDEL